MSKDLIVFDPSNISPVPHDGELLKVIHELVGEGEESVPGSATDKIRDLVLWAGQKYGASVDQDSQWTLWPPALLADGRHCTFNLGLKADMMTFMMLLADQCKRRGLVLIDPSGRNPFVTTPSGAGILD